MGTEKRERQKQNRQLRLESAAKEQQREKTRRRALQIGGGIAAAVVLALLFAIFGGGDDDEATSSDTTVASAEVTDTTVAAETTVTAAPPATAAPAEPITGETPCPDENSERVIAFEQAPPMCIDATKSYTATFTVALEGQPETQELTVDLDAAAAPETVNNFVTLARYHYFDGTVCHRAVPDFVVQCGDPTATGGGGPGYEFGDELPASLDDYVLGALAMANSGPDTNGSQFFFVTSDAASVRFGSPNYSIFGQVTAGLDTTLAAMAGFATETEKPSGLIQIVSVTIAES